MSDLKYRQDTSFPSYAVELDLLVGANNLIEEDAGLRSAMIVALGTDRLAEDIDVLPDIDSSDRRGWWGDMDAEELWSGWPVGSRLWLLERGKIVGSRASIGGTVDRAQSYAREAMQPFLDARIATSVVVTAERTDVNRIDVLIVMYRGPLPEIELRYHDLWSELT